MHIPLEDMLKGINKMYSKLKLLRTEICSEKHESITSDVIVIEQKKVLSYTCARYWNGTSICDAHLKKKLLVLSKQNSSCKTVRIKHKFMLEQSFTTKVYFIHSS